MAGRLRGRDSWSRGLLVTHDVAGDGRRWNGVEDGLGAACRLVSAIHPRAGELEFPTTKAMVSQDGVLTRACEQDGHHATEGQPLRQHVRREGEHNDQCSLVLQVSSLCVRKGCARR